MASSPPLCFFVPAAAALHKKGAEMRPSALLSSHSVAPPRPLARTPFSLPIRTRVGCAYAAAGVAEDSSSVPIDVVANVKTERIVVLGGSGFVGSAICKAAVSKGIEVVSLSRSLQVREAFVLRSLD